MSTQRNDGGPAFPYPVKYFGEGMSKLDWFAGQALPAIIAATSSGQHMPTRLEGKTLVERMAHDAYEVARAMLAARNGEEQ